jgi:spermidine synthase
MLNMSPKGRGVAQPGSASALGAEGRRFKSSRPDQYRCLPLPEISLDSLDSLYVSPDLCGRLCRCRLGRIFMDLWYTEYHTRHVGLTLRVKETLFVSQTEYQTIEVLDTEDYGRVLLLDGLVMTTQRDEFVYHEMIVHPAMYVHPDPKDVLVIGGGDGGAVREVVRHDPCVRVVLCEIDGLVVETAKRFFPEISCALEGNSRVEVVIQDGVKYLEDSTDSFDVIIVDSTDPIGPAAGLFKTDFFKRCFDSLRGDGIMVAQSESPFYHLDLIRQMRENMMEAGFPIVKFCWGFVPTYPSGMWSWAIASKRYDPVGDFDVEKAKRRRIPTRYYTAELHRAAFVLPAFFAQGLGA